MKYNTYEELRKLITEDSGYKEYIEYIRQYFNHCYKYFTNEEKVDFYCTLQTYMPWNAKEDEISTKLMLELDDKSEELEYGDMLYIKGCVEKVDEEFREILEKYNIL